MREPMLLGKHFIAYGFVQQWFKIGGDGRDTNQMNGTFNFTYTVRKRLDPRARSRTFRSIGRRAKVSEGHLDRDHRWARSADAEALPTLFQLQVQYYPIRPDVCGPTWNIQLQATPTIPALIKKALF